MEIPQEINWGCVPRFHGRFARAFGDGDLPTYVDREITLLPRDDWEEDVGIDDTYVKHIFDQLDGMCTSNAFAQAMSLCRSAVQGLPYIVFAPEDGYQWVGRWGTGSTLGDNLRSLMQNGIRTREQCPREWPVEDTPTGRTQALDNRILEAFDLGGGFDAAVTCCHLRIPIVIGVDWPRLGGHAVCVTRYRRGKLWIPNSWGRNSGQNGFYELTEAECRSADRYGQIAIRQVTERPDDPAPPRPEE